MESTLYTCMVFTHSYSFAAKSHSFFRHVNYSCTYTVHTYFPWTFLHILTSSSITITFKNGMHLRKLSSAQMPAKTQIIRLCHVKGSSRLDGPARNFHLPMLVFNALLSIMGDKISCTLCPKLKGLSDVLPTSKRKWSYPFPTPSTQCYASGDVDSYPTAVVSIFEDSSSTILLLVVASGA